ncbi:AGAP007198-PA-like protein [Anopheles sinensis]|uniref:AGAP007198-PA-like protein n=1 Tax=Anopheles sinensis TaxID=74873 RepID=A0A084VC70_ANOSI|nr:AGAP007198-PA-like protein [Anopheles sinensis]
MRTVQTASPWRPQLPLPKDITVHVQQQQKQQDMEKASTTAAGKGGKDKKWSLGSLFRKKKKDVDTDSSSEEDRKAGFVPVKGTHSSGTLNGKRKKRSSRIVGAGFDHIVVSPQQPPSVVHNQQQQQLHPPAMQHQNQYGFREADSVNSIDRYTGNGSLDRRGRKTERGSRHSKERQSSSDEESHRSSSMSRFRSDDSLGNHSAGSHRKSRTARTERYLKRMSRDDGNSPSGGPAVSRWHTQPISPSMVHGGSVHSMDVAYRRHPQHQQQHQHHPHHAHHQQHQHQQQLYPSGSHPNLRNSSSLTNVPHHFHPTGSSPSYAHQLQLAYGSPTNHHQSHGHATTNPGAVTYENSFYIQSKASTMRDAIRSPPPIPPRDPQRRLTIGHTNEARPVSYAFDRYHQTLGAPGQSTIWQPNGKCNSEDRLWGAQVQRTPPPPPTHHGSMGFVNANTVTPPLTPPRNTSAVEYRYVTDVTPRSRKPIQIQDRTFEPFEPKISPLPGPATNTGSESSLAYSGTPTPSGGRGSTTRSLTQATSSESMTGARSTPQQSASAFWRRIEEEQNGVTMRRGRATERRPGVAGAALASRSVSTSRALEIMNRRNQELTRELDTLLDDKQAKRADEEEEQTAGENVVSGRLYLRQTADGTSRAKSNEKLYEVKVKTSRPTVEGVPAKAANRYEEHVAKTVAKGGGQAAGSHGYRRYGEESAQPPMQGSLKSTGPPAPPMRTISKRNSCSEEELARKRKSANLEEAINELEAIYKSLKLSDEDLLERAEQRDLPTPTGFSQRARLYRYDGDADEERAKAEPDLQLDDLSYRSIKRANSSIKAPETQPPFGIPVGPIPPSPSTDYLTVQPPGKHNKPRFLPQRSPDLVADDLAFRQLRKDKDLLASIDRPATVRHVPSTASVNNGGGGGGGNTSSGSEDSRPKGTLSSTIYSQIQRDAAKPSGGNLEDYYKIELYAKSLREANSPNRNQTLPKETVSPVKDTGAKPKSSNSVRPKSSTTPPKENRGAVFNLPSTLKSSASPPKSPKATDGGSPSSGSAAATPTPRPRSGTEPVIVGAKHKAEFEEILNAIALEAQCTSEKLGADLAELRRETQSVSSGTSPEAKPKSKVIAPSRPIASQKTSLTRQRQSNEIDEVAQAAKYCEQMLRDVIEEAPPKKTTEQPKVPTELGKLTTSAPVSISIEARTIVEVHAVEPPTIVEPKPVAGSLPDLGGLIEQLTPAGSFETLSKRCQEQLSELELETDEPDDERVKSSIERDYDNLVESITTAPFESDTNEKSTEEEIDQIMKECGIEIEVSPCPTDHHHHPVKSAQKVPASAQADLTDLPKSTSSEPKSSSETDPTYPTKSSSLKSDAFEVQQPPAVGRSSVSSSPGRERRNGASRSPPVSSVRLTPSDTESQYNSSEELAMIFGIKSPTPSGKGAAGNAACSVPSLLSLSCAKPKSPVPTLPSPPVETAPHCAPEHDIITPTTIATDEHDGGDGIVFSMPVPILSPSPTTRNEPTSTVESVCRSATNTNTTTSDTTNSIACNNVTTNHTDRTTTTSNPVEEPVEELTITTDSSSIGSFYLRSGSFGNHLHHSLDTIHEDLAEEELLEETNAADVDSTTTDSGNVSLNDFGSEFGSCTGGAGTTPLERKVTFVNELQIGPGGYYPFRSVLQIPEIFIEDVSSSQQDEPPVKDDSVDELQEEVMESAGHQPETDVEDPPVETFEELQRLDAERRRQEIQLAKDQLQRRARGESDRGSSSSSGSSGNSSVGGGPTKRKSSGSSSSLVQPQHVVLACVEETDLHPSTTESSSIVSLAVKPTGKQILPAMMPCLGGQKPPLDADAVEVTVEPSIAARSAVVHEEVPEPDKQKAPASSQQVTKATRNLNRDSSGALQNLCFCLL